MNTQMNRKTCILVNQFYVYLKYYDKGRIPIVEYKRFRARI